MLCCEEITKRLGSSQNRKIFQKTAQQITALLSRPTGQLRRSETAKEMSF
jgi:hypothetical protein